MRNQRTGVFSTARSDSAVTMPGRPGPRPTTVTFGSCVTGYGDAWPAGQTCGMYGGAGSAVVQEPKVGSTRHPPPSGFC